MRHIVVTTVDEDAVQWERGWNGTLQHFVAHMPVASSDARAQAERSHQPAGGSNPFSRAIVANMTAVATSTDFMIRVEGSALDDRQLDRVPDRDASWTSMAHTARRSDSATSRFETACSSPDTLPYFEQFELESSLCPAECGEQRIRPHAAHERHVALVAQSELASGCEGSPPTETFGDLPEGFDATDYAGAIDPDPGVEDWTEGWTFYSRLGALD